MQNLGSTRRDVKRLTGRWNSSAILLVVCIVAASILSTIVTTYAEPIKSKVAATKKDAAVDSGSTHKTDIPVCLRALKLTEKQTEQVKEIVASYDADLASVWKDFSHRYQENVALEASLLAAIEDNLSEVQKTHVREQRRKTARSNKPVASPEGKATSESKSADDPVEEEITIIGISLSADQREEADKVHESYLGQLRSLNRDISALHARLVALEADKLVELEKVLTKEQLSELCHSRKHGGKTHPDATDRGDSKRSSK